MKLNRVKKGDSSTKTIVSLPLGTIYFWINTLVIAKKQTQYSFDFFYSYTIEKHHVPSVTIVLKNYYIF